MKFTNKDKDGALKGIFNAYLILILHIFLIAGIGFIVLFFKGFIEYLPWIFTGYAVFFIFIGYLLYIRVKNASNSLNNLMMLPAFQGRSVEIKLLGGLVSIKSDQTSGQKNIVALDMHKQSETLLLENPDNNYIKQLTYIAEMLEKNLITRDEYDHAKKQLFDPLKLNTIELNKIELNKVQLNKEQLETIL